jgi:hypothetical protein
MSQEFSYPEPSSSVWVRGQCDVTLRDPPLSLGWGGGGGSLPELPSLPLLAAYNFFSFTTETSVTAVQIRKELRDHFAD